MYGAAVPCPDQKAPHATLAEARRAAEKMNDVKQREVPRQRLHPYRCRHCGFFHIGRRLR